jgi:hypothetical protein
LHPAHQILLYRTFDGHEIAAIDSATAINTQFWRGLRPLAPRLSSPLSISCSSVLMKVANTQHKYVLSSPTCLSHLLLSRLRSKYWARNNHVSGFRNDTAVHKINSPKSGSRRALNSMTVITLLLLTRACPSYFLLSSSQSHPFSNTSLIFLFLCQDASLLVDRSTLSGLQSPHILPYTSLYRGSCQ